MVKRKTKAPQCSKTERNLLFAPSDEEYTEILKMWKNWIDVWHQLCRVKDYLIASRRWLRSRKLHPRRPPKQCRVVLWNLMNPRGNEWNLLSPKNREDHTAGRGCTSMSHYNLVHKFIPMPQVTERKSTLPHWWTYVTSKMRSWIPNYRSTKTESCSVVIL